MPDTPSKWAIKKGELLTLNGTLTVDGVVTSNANCVVKAQIRDKNRNVFNLFYSSLEVDVPTRGKFKLTLNTAIVPVGTYEGDIKFVLSDTSIHYDDTFEIEISDPVTQT